jgi:hypothetical protein
MYESDYSAGVYPQHPRYLREFFGLGLAFPFVYS